MKKKILFVMLCALSMCFVMGCSKADDQQTSQPPVQNENNQAEKENDAEKVSTVVGRLDEVKDFMFIITDANGISYAFTHDVQPEEIKTANIGDTVKVTYTGIMSEVDAFTGDILSVEIQK